MATAVQKITLSSSRDIPFNKLVLSQCNVRRVKAGISVEELAESIARRGLTQSACLPGRGCRGCGFHKFPDSYFSKSRTLISVIPGQ